MSSSSTNSGNTAIASATETGAGTLQGGVIQAVATQETTVGITDTDAKTVSATGSSNTSGAISATSAKASTASVTSSASTTSSSSSSTSAKVTSASTTSASQATTTTGSSSAPSSQSKASSTTSASVSASTSSAASSVQATQTPDLSATDSAGFTAIQVVSTGTIDGHLTTLTTQVFAATSTTSAQPTSAPLGASESFFKNKAAVGGVFGAAGLVFLILLLAIVLKIVRYRSRRKFEKDLDEQVEQEVRSGTPMFGLGKEDDGWSIMGGRAGGTNDPEKAAYANGGNGYNTAAYPSYGGSVPLQAAQPAYYSPNASNGVPRRRPSQDQSQYSNYRGGGLSRTNSRSSDRSYGSLTQPPMNAFTSSPHIPAGTNAPALAPATFSASYGEYRHASPVPSIQSWQSRNQAAFGARPGTPSSLTPGGRGNSNPAPPGNAYTSPGASPAVLARYDPSYSLRNSKEGFGADAYIAGQITQIHTRNIGSLAAPTHLKQPPSPNIPLPNPFDQRD